MQFREFQTLDVNQVSEIYDKDFSGYTSLPNLDHTIGDGVILSNDRVVAFGMVKCYPEAIIIIDQSIPMRDRVGSLQILYENAIRVCRNRRFKEMNAVIHNDGYGKLLAKHFNFRELPGKLMQVRIED